MPRQITAKRMKLHEETPLITLTQDCVRLVSLAAQDLLHPPTAPAAKCDLLPLIHRLAYLQIDTIHAVRRSQYLVLWSRLGDYNPAWLDEIHQEGHLFEYYAHALCYLPGEDYPIFRGRMLYDERVGKYWQGWADANPEVIEQVRSVVMENGPICSSDFNTPTVPTGWGRIKQEKFALQRMFATGEMMVPFRVNFRRYYDLRKRVLPNWDDADALDAKAALEALILKAVYALGVAREDWVAPYYFLPKTDVLEILRHLAAQGKIKPVTIEGWKQPTYVHKDQISLLEAITRGDFPPSHITFLSPFDPLISDRDRTRALFNFDYKMEAFTPARDRQYGYFCLPILYKGWLVGRLDPKAHRKRKLMEIKNLYLEQGVTIDDDLIIGLKTTLKAFAEWHGMKELQISAAHPSELGEALL